MKQEDASDWRQSIFDDLHQVAERALADEAPGHSLQPTLLVNDAYMRLLAQRNVSASNRAQVLAAGAQIIRRLLIDYARKRKRLKRGGTTGRGNALMMEIATESKHLDLLDVHEALERMSVSHARASQIVEMKFFGGLTGEEIASVLGVSRRTVNEDWTYAKAWLYKEMAGESP